jgi:hypothetical protein
MRLIDADKFCDFVNKNCTDNLAGLWCELINMQPIAYDVDKVIQKVQETIRAYETPAENCLNNPNCNDTDCTECLLQEITAIIREGGNL